MTKITQDFNQTKSGRTIKRLWLFVLLLMGAQMSWGQAQVLGAFKEIDGGFEGQTNGAIAPVSQYGAVANAWTTQGGGSFPAIITEDAAVARSGKKSYVYTATGGAKYNYGPLLVNNPFVTSTATKYTIQFYNKHTTGTDAVANILQKLAYTGNGSTANERFYSAGTSVSYAMNVWVKTYFTFTTSTLSAAGTNCAGLRSVGPGTGNTIGGVVDDYVVYEGDFDTTLPDAPTVPIVSGLNVSWTAADPLGLGGGVDGGGYMVVRYATNPNANNDPNANGIYAKGNTITNGTGSLVGTVVYTGTGTTFIDDVAGSVSGSDYYKIYTVDKAFNYSEEIIAGPVAASTSTTWTTSWSNGTPDSTVEAVIDGTYNGIAFDAKKLTINSGKSLTVTSGNMTIINEVINNGGTVTFENNTNLIQNPATTVNANTGDITVKRNSNPLYRLDYTMWSSPTGTTQTVSEFSPLTTTGRFYEYNSGTNLYNIVADATPFSPGKGFLIRMPNTDPTSGYDVGTATLSYEGVFTGIPNNGDVNIAGTAGQYVAVGNPYPSALSADAFIDANSAGTGSGTLYFWRKTNNLNQSSTPTTSYATYTKAGPVGLPAGSGVANGGFTPNGNIAVGQGFITTVPTSGTISFTNALRSSSTTAQFLRTKAVAEKSRVWLNLSAGTNPVNQMMVAYMDGATTGVDNGIDGKYINDSPTALTSVINNEEYVIQGRPAFDVSDIVALNFKTDVAGTFTIAKDRVDGLFANGQDIYLVDATTGTETNLQTDAYTFTAVVGVDNSRFRLTYKTSGALKVNALAFDENSISVYKQNGVLNINAGNTTMKNVKVFDITGRLILEQKAINATTTSLKNLGTGKQALLIQITSNENKVVTKKAIN